MTDIRDSVACMEMTNLTGYTQHLHDGMELGEVSEATITTMKETDSPTIGQMLEHGDTTHLRRVCQDENEEWRRTKVRELFHPTLHLDAQELLCSERNRSTTVYGTFLLLPTLREEFHPDRSTAACIDTEGRKLLLG